MTTLLCTRTRLHAACAFVIDALEQCTPQERRCIEKVLEERAFRSVNHQQILDVLNRYGSVETALARAAEFASAARSNLLPFADSEYKRALLWVPDFVVAREK